MMTVLQKEMERIKAEMAQWAKWKQECAELYMNGSRNNATTKEELEAVVLE